MTDRMGDCRKGNYMVTSTGNKYWPLDPRADEVEIEAIAHHLAMKCRWAGATRRFYSVAEHSVWCSHLVPETDALEALLHDASEAYNGDLIRPLKYTEEFSAPFMRVEALNEAAIAERFGLRHPWPASVKEADNAIGAAERDQLITHHGEWTGINYPVPPAQIELMCWAPHIAKVAFLSRFHFLMAGRR